MVAERSREGVRGPTESWVFESRSEADTERLGRALAEALRPGSVVALVGPLGAGKTFLVRALAAGLAIDPRSVASPTFVLIHEYRGGRLPLYHFDAYRLSDARQFTELGVEEYFRGQGVSVVEWADRVPECLPGDRLEIRIEVTGPVSRRIVLTACGSGYHELVHAVSQV